MKCLECSKLDLRANPRHANLGLGKCSHDEPGRFQIIERERECKNFAKADDEIIQKRVQWWSKRDMLAL